MNIFYLFFIISLVISLLAEIFVKFTYRKYKKVPTTYNITGAQLLDWFTKKYNIFLSSKISNTPLSDHYDPRNETVTLSQEVANNPSVASVAITAHELGHVLQKHTGYIFFKLRSFIVPVTNIGTQLGYWLMLIGLILNAFNLAFIGLVFFSMSFVFILITLPVEFNASARALKMLKENKILTPSELSGARMILISAALTYVAAMITSLLNLLYFALRVMSLKDRD